MQPLYDMLAAAQGGQAMAEIARRYGLTMRQSQSALEALLPAFGMGLKRNASDPYGMAALLQALATGRHAGYFADPASAFSPAGRDEGDAVLAHLFGSPQVSSAVAAEAAQMTGLAQETLRQMMPALAAMVMGGLYRQSVPAGDMPANPLQEAMRLMTGLGPAVQAPRPQAARPTANMFDNPFLAALNGMFGGPAEREPAPPRNPSGRPRTTYDDLFDQLFETGRKTRDDYEKAMRAVFERHSGGG